MSCREHFELTRQEWADDRLRRAERCSHEERTCTYNGVPMCRPCFDDEGRERMAVEKERRAVRDACPACIEGRERERAIIQERDTIDPEQPYGEHIALTCKNHPELRWNTKNIGHIGARTIFFNGFWQGLTECECPVRDLEVVK